MEEKEKRNIFLFIIGLLMILGGIYLLKNASFSTFTGVILSKTSILIYSVTILIANVLQILVGIIGIRQSGKPGKNRISTVLGMVVITLTIASEIIVILLPRYKIDLATVAFGIILPAMFVVASLRTKKPVVR